jgi:hypothetical protein
MLVEAASRTGISVAEARRTVVSGMQRAGSSRQTLEMAR